MRSRISPPTLLCAQHSHGFELEPDGESTTNAGIYPIEHVYGYVEVKAVFCDHLDRSLTVSRHMRETNFGFYQYAASTSEPLVQRVGTIKGDRGRLLCWLFAFEYQREDASERPLEAVTEAFDAAWQKVGYQAHFAGVLLAELHAKQLPGRRSGDAAFLRSRPSPGADTNPALPAFRSELVATDGIGAFKRQMLTDLSLFARRQWEFGVNHDGYLGVSRPSVP